MKPGPFISGRTPALRGLVPLALATVLAACATPPSLPRELPPLENQPRIEIDRVDPLAMSPEMAAWTRNHVRGAHLSRGRAWALAYAALDPYLLAFEYDPRVTLSAQDAFEQQRGNCLTFSYLFVAMARESRLEAWFREVAVQPEWNSIDDTMLVSMHVNAAVSEHGKEYVVDVSRRKMQGNERVRRLSDEEAEAQFYNNLGVDALVDNDLARAYAYFSQSLEIMPNLAYVWSNLGVVYRRNDQTPDARLAYRTAQELDPTHSVSLNNLYLIYEEEGNFEAAEAVAEQVEHLRRGNPFYLHYLAEVANEEARYEEAEVLLTRAIRLHSSEYRFHHTMAQTQYLLGNPEKARASLNKARRLAPEGFDTASLTLQPAAGLPPDS